MQQPNQQAYDRGTTIFSPDGRLYQVEYAREAVQQGAPVVGVRGDASVVFAAHASARSPLVESPGSEKLSGVDDHVAVGSAGHAADTRRLVDVARQTAQNERLRYGEATTVDALATSVADHVQECTQTGGRRPYGTALLVAGHDDQPQLFEVDPSGATREWRADAVGQNASAALDVFEDRYDAPLDERGALELALAGLDAAVEDLAPGDVGVTTVSEAGRQTPDEEDVVAAHEAVAE
jgi:proteasome alpha subunit